MKTINKSKDFENLFNFIPDAILTIDTDYKILNWNHYAEEITGYTKEEMVGKDCMSFTVDPCDLRCCVSDRGDRPAYKKICKIKTKDGMIKSISKKVDYLYEGEKKIGFIETFEDMTYSESLYDELIMYLTAIEQSANVIVITDTLGNIVYVNEAFEKTTGYIKTESIGNNPRILKTNCYDENFYKDLWLTISSGKTWNGIFRNKKKDGSEYWERSVITPIKGKNNNIIYYLAIKEDITENKIKEEKLTRLLNEYESIFNNNAVGLVLLKNGGTIKKINNRFEELTGFSNNEIEGKSFSELHFSGFQYDSDVYTNAFKKIEKGEIISIEHKFKIKNDNIIWASITGKAVDADDMSKGVLWAFYDITKEKKLEEYKKSINQIMHHDLRSPVASIIGITDHLLNINIDLADENKKMIRMISDVGKNMINQMNTFLSMSKIEEGTYKYQPVRINIISMIYNIIKMLEPINNFMNIKNTNVLIIYNNKLIEETGRIFIISDENLLNNILNNLLKNAVEATPENENITISINDTNDFIISIHNKGAIPENIRNKFFEKFNTGGKEGGMGIGTYSVKLMSEVIGAEITYDSTDMNGTTIFISFRNLKNELKIE